MRAREDGTSRKEQVVSDHQLKAFLLSNVQSKCKVNENSVEIDIGEVLLCSLKESTMNRVPNVNAPDYLLWPPG